MTISPVRLGRPGPTAMSVQVRRRRRPVRCSGGGSPRCCWPGVQHDLGECLFRYRGRRSRSCPRWPAPLLQRVPRSPSIMLASGCSGTVTVPSRRSRQPDRDSGAGRARPNQLRPVRQRVRQPPVADLDLGQGTDHLGTDAGHQPPAGRAGGPRTVVEVDPAEVVDGQHAGRCPSSGKSPRRPAARVAAKVPVADLDVERQLAAGGVVRDQHLTNRRGCGTRHSSARAPRRPLARRTDAPRSRSGPLPAGRTGWRGRAPSSRAPWSPCRRRSR